jgi:hypothetical protein
MGNPLQSFNPREFGIDVGYSRKLGENTGFGVGLKYIYSNLAGGSVGGNTYKAGTSVAGDLGFITTVLAKQDRDGLLVLP